MLSSKKFKDMVDRVVELVRREGEISKHRLAYMLNISPTKASDLLKAAADVVDKIQYNKGIAIWVEDESDPQK